MIRSVFILFFLSIGLFARVNPFEPINANEDFVVTKTKVTNEPKVNNSSNSSNKTTLKSEDKIKSKKNVSNKKIAKTTKKNIQKEIIKKQKTKHISKKSQQTNKNILIKRIEKPIIVEQRNIILPIQNAIRYNIFPLLSIDLLNHTITITTSNNYKLIKHYEDSSSKKFVLDFKANVSIPSARENFNSIYFKSYAVGNHPEDGFFRVVIVTNDDVSNYKLEIKNNMAVIANTLDKDLIEAN